MRKLITCKCDHCQTEFQKPESEHKRNLKLGRENFCTRSCSGKAHAKFVMGKSTYDISQHSGSNKDEYTPYRYYLRNALKRTKEVNLTFKDLEEQWNKQQSLCPYSGLKLTLATLSSKGNHPYLTASLDRIDSSKGYVVGNIQFTSMALNFMKAVMSHDQTIELCKHITNYHNTLKN